MGIQRTFLWAIAATACATVGGSSFTAFGVSEAVAQSWLPWTAREEPERRPSREPTRPDNGAPNYGQFRQPGNGGQQGGRPQICLQLEQRLALDAHRNANSAGSIRRLEGELRSAQEQKRRADLRLDRQECYETFLFTRSLRPTRQCHALDRQSRVSGRRIEEIRLELRKVRSGGDQANRDEVIRALARNGCGRNYERVARQRDPFMSFWQDNDGSGTQGSANIFGGLPFATYRTVCVRTCDGYYFPVSFSTLPTHFARDEKVCQSKCAAPTQLYYHQNPGGSVDQMVSHRSQQPYSSLSTAFRYRKEFVKGCSCKVSEYAAHSGATASIPQSTPGQSTSGQPSSGQSAPGQSTPGNAADTTKKDNTLSPIR